MQLNTVGELMTFLDNFSDDTPLIIDVDGNTVPFVLEKWSNEQDSPLAVFVSPILDSLGI